MPIYVDPLGTYGWKIRGRTVRNCHMFTDALDLEELHIFAERIGLRRAWFQDHRIAPHYDLTPSRREQALACGAVDVNRRTAVALWQARRELAVTLAAAVSAAAKPGADQGPCPSATSAS